MRKLLLAALAAFLVLGTLPLSAELYGTWAGEGSGLCYPRTDVVIYPWQAWKGEVYISPDQEAPIFEGTWYDELGNNGTFRGFVFFTPIEDQAIAEGSWTWFDPLSMSPGPRFGGKFEMSFSIEGEVCQGTWNTIWPSPSEVGTMEGEKVD